MTLGGKIKSIRKINKLNQNEFSNIIGVSQGTLSELETDKYAPSLEIILDIKTNFGVDLEWILLDSTEKEHTKLFMTRLDNSEIDLISNFRKLNTRDKREITEIMKLKINHYNNL